MTFGTGSLRRRTLQVLMVLAITTASLTGLLWVTFGFGWGNWIDTPGYASILSTSHFEKHILGYYEPRVPEAVRKSSFPAMLATGTVSVLLVIAYRTHRPSALSHIRGT